MGRPSGSTTWKGVVLRRLPPNVSGWLIRIKSKVESIGNSKLSAEEVFTNIYHNNKWGGSKGEFYSGSGSSDPSIVSKYIDTVSNILREARRGRLSVVDLGCGDFQIGRRIAPLADHYTGVDVVGTLISRNRALFGTDRVAFAHLDITTDTLPVADVCLIREVLQHLSNGQISTVLEKVRSYPLVIITERYPGGATPIVPNIDKVQGAHIRVSEKSGVYLTEPPFNLPAEELQLVLEVPATRTSVIAGDEPGSLRTYLYKPARPYAGESLFRAGEGV